MLFLGGPGTGKTTVADIVAPMLQSIGAVKTDKVLKFGNARHALVDGHVGCTTGKATRVIKDAEGGVLFLDEVCAFSTCEVALGTCIQIAHGFHTPLYRRTLSSRRAAVTTTRKTPSMCCWTPSDAAKT